MNESNRTMSRTITVGISILFIVLFAFSSSFSLATEPNKPSPEMHAGARITRGSGVNPRVAAFNRELAAYKQSVAALRRDTQRLQAQDRRLDTMLKDLNASAQIDMINLQSLISARQTAVQLSTNMLKSLENSQRQIVNNIK